MTHQMFDVKGMTCQNCVETITEALRAESQIQDLHVTLNPAKIHFNSNQKYSADQVNRLLAPLKKYTVTEALGETKPNEAEPFVLSKYIPLILLFGLSAGVPLLNVIINHAGFDHWMYQFMGATLISLSYFKLIDLPKFAEAFSTYDPVAMKFYKYGYVYPFFELTAGIGFILSIGVEALSVLVILILIPTTLGVLKALREKRKFQCACLGTAFNLPLTKVTIAENILMIAMSVMIVLS
jgi:copper chaperone CopZ